MNRSIASVILGLLLSVNAAAAELSVTLKPNKGIKGTHSMTFHEDGKVSLLVYQSASKIIDNVVDIEPSQSLALQHLASEVLSEYLFKQSFSELPSHSLKLAIMLSDDGVTKSVSSHKLNANAIHLVNQVGRYVPENYRALIAP
ncbi:MAG: hypothetical protein V7707_01205 [Motiliproteus sp.]